MLFFRPMSMRGISSLQTISKLALALFILDVVLAIAGIVPAYALEADPSYTPFQAWSDMAGNIGLGLAFALVGGLIAVKRQANVIGWALLVGSLGVLTYDLTLHYGELALLAKPEAGLPGGMLVAMLGGGSWTLIVMAIFFLLLLFPDGTLPSRRWRYLARAVPALLILVWVLFILSFPKGDPPFDDFKNPFALTDKDDYMVAVFPIIFFCLFCTGAAGIDLIVRFWRSKGDEREQFKWLAFATALLVVTFPLQGSHPVVDAFGGLAFLALPVAVGIAVLKYRLYDIDLLINRTLVYVPLTGVVIGVYTALVGVLKTIATELTGTETDAAVAITTLLVVAILTPLKNQLQKLVDVYFKETRDPLASVRALSIQADSVVEVLDGVRFVEKFLTELIRGLDADGAQADITAVHEPASVLVGTPNATAPVTVPLISQGRKVGVLLVWPKAATRTSGELVEILEEAAPGLANVVAFRLSLEDASWLPMNRLSAVFASDDPSASGLAT